MLKLHQKATRPVGRFFYTFYFGVHVLFCTVYMLGLLWWGQSVGYFLLATIIGASSIWVFRQAHIFKQAGRAPAPPFALAGGCLLLWCIFFPLFLTHRQWLLRNGKLQ